MCRREVGLGQVGASEGGRCWGLLEAAAGSRQQPQQTCCLFIPQRPGHPFVRSHLPPFHQKWHRIHFSRPLLVALRNLMLTLAFLSEIWEVLSTQCENWRWTLITCLQVYQNTFFWGWLRDVSKCLKSARMIFLKIQELLNKIDWRTTIGTTKSYQNFHILPKEKKKD